jgi:hypothetical protein
MMFDEEVNYSANIRRATGHQTLGKPSENNRNTIEARLFRRTHIEQVVSQGQSMGGLNARVTKCRQFLPID